VRLTAAGPSAIRSAGPADLARLGPLYERAGFGAHLAGVVEFARARLGGEVVVAEADGDLAGVAAGALFGGTGWIGGVGVAPDHRRAGLGAALTQSIIEFLEACAATTILLHATALGRPVYERLGFVPEVHYLTLTGPALPRTRRRPLGLAAPGGTADPEQGGLAALGGTGDPEQGGPAAPGGTGDPELGGIVPPVRAGQAGDLEAVLALDRAATGEDRRRLLAALWPAGGLVAGGAGAAPLGFQLASPWRSAGAIVAADPQAGLALLEAARRVDGDEVSMSVPATNTRAVQALEAAGFRERYRTVRMHRGPRIPWHPTAVFAAQNLFWG
jgi:ribosomal protein S18 acetylase RimI-like enzyme